MSKKDFFDQVAVSQDPLLFTEADREKIQQLKRRLGDLKGMRVLEPGCGAGPLTEYLSDWVGDSGHILAFDASPGMVRECHRRIGHLRNVELVEGNVETIKLAHEAWDVIILFRVFPHIDDKLAVLQRLRPCLAPGGRFVIVNLEGSTRLNHLHAGFSESVRHDHMPCAVGTTRLLEEAGWDVREALNEPEDFFVLAVLPQADTTARA
jgi:ubiquinone/menaquinone biosynthesis C-methylase UbiE